VESERARERVSVCVCVCERERERERERESARASACVYTHILYTCMLCMYAEAEAAGLFRHEACVRALYGGTHTQVNTHSILKFCYIIHITHCNMTEHMRYCM